MQEVGAVNSEARERHACYNSTELLIVSAA